MSAADHSGRAELLRVFLRHEVKFVVIGGAAIQSHGRTYDTQDIDLTPDRDETNLLRLAAALNELECRLVTDPLDPSGWVALPADYFTPRSLSAASVWNLATPHGLLDLSFTPSGFPPGLCRPGEWGQVDARRRHINLCADRVARRRSRVEARR